MRPIKGYDKDFLWGLLEEMLLTRRFEEKAGQMYGLKKIGGFCHLYNGQEAVSSGIAAATKRGEDALLTGYRDHAHALTWGITPNAIMAELYGKETGCSKGKGGSMHLFDAQAHMYGGNGIVGGQIPVAAGVAFAQRYKKEKNITVVLFGDGAIHQGAFHESMNLAKIWKLPLLLICENNQYGMGTAMERVSAVKDLSVKGVAYDIPSKQINGMDVIEVYEEIKKAKEQILKEETPVFYEIKTYRYKGHSMSDPAKYRTKEEMEKFQKQDPIQSLKERMIEAKMIKEEDYKDLDKKLKAVVMEAVQFADESPQPPLSAMYDDILV